MDIPEMPLPFRIDLDIRQEPNRPRRSDLPIAKPTLFDGLEAHGILSEARLFARDQDQVIQHYEDDPETWGGAYVSGDELLRMLPTRPRSPWLTYALGGGPLAVIPRTLLSRRLAHPSQPGERVLLTMGMPGTGKTTLVKGGLGKAFYSVVDSPLGSFELARQLVKEIQSSGRGVSFLLAWRSIPEAVFGMLERAMPGHEERAVALLDMADLVLKCLDTFQQLADFNRFDGDVTLDVVHTRSHVRTWCHGAEAANFMIPAVRNVLLGHPQGILGQVLTAWKSALRSCSKPIPEALRAVAELGVNLGSVGEEIMAKSLDNEVDGTVQPFKATFKAIHSLQDIPGWKESIPGFLRTADKYEASLRAADGGAY